MSLMSLQKRLGLKEAMRQGGWSIMWLIVLFWVAMAGVSTFQTYYFYSMMPSSPAPVRAVYLAVTYSFLWALVTPLILMLARVFPIDRNTLLRNLPLHLLFSILVGLAHRLLWLWAQITIPAIRPKSELTAQRLISDLVTSFDYQAMVYWVMLAMHQGALYYRKYQEGKLRASQLEAQLAQAQLSGLKMQLHPHFLFNTLHNINSMMYESVDRASEMICGLSDFLRISLENSGLHQIPLERELDFIERYLEIERNRFDERLEVDFRVDDAALHTLVPNLLLQPLVENAIKHGIARSARGGKIIISAKERNGTLSVCVANTGPSLSSDSLSGAPFSLGIGLANTRARLRALYGEDARFELRNRPEGGVEAVITLPARQEEAVSHESAHC
jgi:signal transduction histidine kinase